MSVCAICKEPCSLIQRHHLFSQTKVNKRLYPEHIHRPENIINVCVDCHLNKPIPKYTEREFCEVMGIAPRSKTERMRLG